jgi:xanthine dehydrogenase YagS FAD-binding subunit
LLPQFSYVRPNTLKETIRHLNTQGTVAHAGGTDLIGCLREGILSVDKVVSLSALDDLHGITETADGGLIIGALTKFQRIRWY